MYTSTWKYFVCVYVYTYTYVMGTYVLGIPEFHGSDSVGVHVHRGKDAACRQKWFGWFKRWTPFTRAALDPVSLKTITKGTTLLSNVDPRSSGCSPLWEHNSHCSKSLLWLGWWRGSEPIGTKFLNWSLVLTQKKDWSFEEIWRKEFYLCPLCDLCWTAHTGLKEMVTSLFTRGESSYLYPSIYF